MIMMQRYEILNRINKIKRANDGKIIELTDMTVKISNNTFYIVFEGGFVCSIDFKIISDQSLLRFLNELENAIK